MRGLNENVPIQDTFCSGIGAIEPLEGGMLRFWLYVLQTPADGGDPEKVVVAKIVVPKSAVSDAILQMVASISDCEGVLIPPLTGAVKH
jgi:hypothetical protein